MGISLPTKRIFKKENRQPCDLPYYVLSLLLLSENTKRTPPIIRPPGNKQDN